MLDPHKICSLQGGYSLTSLSLPCRIRDWTFIKCLLGIRHHVYHTIWVSSFDFSGVLQIGLFHFTNENTDSERLSNLCKFTQLVSGRVRICTFVFRPAYWIQCSPPRPKGSWLIVVETPSCLFLRGTEHFSKTNILLEESLWAGSWRTCADHGDESVKLMAWTWCIPLQMNYKTALLLVLNIKEKLNPFILPLQGKSPP